MGALQVWQSLSEAQGRGHGDRDVAILFTDLVDFSDWVLEAGDDAGRRAGARGRRGGRGRRARARRARGQAARRRADGRLRRPGGRRAGGAARRRPRSASCTRRACAPASTSGARASSAATTSASTSTSPRASPRRPAAARCSSPTRSATGSIRTQISTRRRWRFKPKGAPKGLQAYVAELPGNAPAMRALASAAVLAGLLACSPRRPPPPSARTRAAATVPGAERQEQACLDDLTTAGTQTNGHTDRSDWEGLHAAGTQNPTGVPGPADRRLLPGHVDHEHARTAGTTTRSS